MAAAIRVENLSKMYRIGRRREGAGYRTLRETIMDAAAAPWRKFRQLVRRADDAVADQPADTIWALKDISCEVQPGEALGIIGRNGAGKSTFLKILSRITEPTAGRVELRGRVGSLLEVGTGFHPELTGRENVFLNGVIMGMTRREIARKFDEIVDFAGIAPFLDTPVKRYSSGMYVRLAFAVAAHLDTEILVADEVLAVGDAAFQKKCLGKMGDVARQGKTVLFVSHNMIAVQALCQRALWLNDGKILDDGPANQVVSRYLSASTTTQYEQRWDDPATAPGNDHVRLHAARIRPLQGGPADPITIRTPMEIAFEYWNFEEGAHLNLSIHLFNEQGILVLNSASLDDERWQERAFPAQLIRHTCVIPGDLLNEGMYRIELLVVKDQAIVLHRHMDILIFTIHDDVTLRNAWFGKWPGVIHPRLQWSTELTSR